MTKYDIEEKVLQALGLGVTNIKKLTLTLEHDMLPVVTVTTETFDAASDDFLIRKQTLEFGPGLWQPANLWLTEGITA